MSDLSMRAKGRWRSILQALGVSADYLSGKHGPCPSCAGTDRFRFDDKDGRGTFFCSQCGAGDGFALLQRVNGYDFPAAARAVEGIVGSCPAEAPQAPLDPAKVRAAMNNMWRQAHNLEGVDATRAWWMRRLGSVPACTDLKGADEIYHSLTKRRFPAMLAMVRGADGKPVNLHRTYLTTAGAKAPVERPRMIMPLELPAGSAVRLAQPQDGRIGIAEGIETAACATALTGIPCWAALNAGNMAKWTPPADLAVTVFADNDDSYTGAASAYTLARRLRSMGVTVEVQIPSARGEDWADVWAAHLEMQRGRAA